MNKHLLTTALALAATLGSIAPASAAKLVLLNIDPPGAGLNDGSLATPVGGNPGRTVGEQRRIAYKFAMDLMGAGLHSDVDVKIYASFQPLSCSATGGALGAAGPNWIDRDFPGAPLRGTWYHSSVADSIAGVDLDPDPADPGDVVSFFNSALGGKNPDGTACLTGSGWYYGLDGNTPPNLINFLNVVMHEASHGLGFAGLMNKATGELANFDGTPRSDAYTHFAYDNVRNLRFDSKLMDNRARAQAIVTPGRLVWSGPQVTAEAPAFLDKRFILSVTAPAGIVGSYQFGLASFGPLPTAANFTGQLLLGNDGTAPTADGCQAFPAGFFTGRIALMDRGGCAFTIKVKNAQDAGATAAVIADNAAGSPPPGIGGSDPTIIIPAVRITLADGNTFKANMPVSVAFSQDPVLLQGADDSGRVNLYAPTVLAGGSSFSHFDPSLTPNSLIEPFINGDLQGNFRIDLIQPLFRDVGWQQSTGNAKIRTCDTGVPLVLLGGSIPGANVQAAEANCLRNVGPSRSNSYKACMINFANGLLASGTITAAQDTSLRACIGVSPSPG